MQEKENKKAKTKDLDKSADLLKIQVCSERIHVRLTYLTTTSWAIWISFSVLFYTLYWQNLLPLLAIIIGMITLTLGIIYVVYRFRKSYKKRTDEDFRNDRKNQARKRIAQLRRTNKIDKSHSRTKKLVTYS